MIDLPQSTESKKSKPKLPRRERLRDYPMRGYAYSVTVKGALPEWVEMVGEQMRKCWNDMCGEMYRALKPIRERERAAFAEGVKPSDAKACKQLQKEFDAEKRATLKPFKDTKFLRSIAQRYKGILPSDCYYKIVDRFLKALQEAPSRRSLVFQAKGFASFECGLPSFKEADDIDLHLPVVYNSVAGGETTFADLYGEGGKVSLWRLPEASYFGGNCLFTLKQPQGSGSKWGPIKLEIDFHRLPPMDAIVKGVTLVRRKEIGERWSISFSLEIPPVRSVRQKTGRVCGYDSAGWRKFDDRVRVGVLTDNAGFSYEISMPLDLATERDKRMRAHIEAKGGIDRKITSWPQLIELDERIGQAVEECKAKLRAEFERSGAEWPEEARKAMGGIAKMRQGGLLKVSDLLRKKCGESDPCECRLSEPFRFLEEWVAKDAEMWHWKRVFQLQSTAAKEDAWRKISVWIAQNFDVVAWEGDKAMLKRMAEKASDDPAIKASQKYRQFAGQSVLRLYVRQACDKWSTELQDKAAAWSAQTCNECGGEIVKSGKLLRVCENGHKQDTDANSSLFFLKQIEGATSIKAEPVAIPVDLRRYLRLMSINEAGIDVVK